MDARLAEPEPNPLELNDLVLKVMRGVNGQAFRLFGNKVLSGPFCGMVIPELTVWDDGNAGTKLLGSYEHELHEALAHALWRDPKVLVNVGCAEGYYAIGLARIKKDLSVIGLDVNEDLLKTCREYADLNKVQIELVEGARTPQELQFSALSGHRLYIIDCEGDEIDLVDLEKCPELAQSDLIIECHDFLRPKTSLMLADRLAATHKVVLILPQLPNFDRFDFVKRFPTVMSLLIVVEKRPMPCCWIACWANSRRT